MDVPSVAGQIQYPQWLYQATKQKAQCQSKPHNYVYKILYSIAIHTASSASPGNVIFCPFCIPFSTTTSSTFFSWTTFSPLHWVHRSLSLMVSPVPLHSLQGCCICWIIEGPRCLIDNFIPVPWQPAQVIEAPDFDPFLQPIRNLLPKGRQRNYKHALQNLKAQHVPIAFWTQHVSWKREFLRRSKIKILQRDLQRVNHIFSPSLPPSSTATTCSHSTIKNST